MIKDAFCLLLMAIVFYFLLVLAGFAHAVTLAWDHSDPDKVSGYNLYYQPADQSAGPYKTTVTGGGNAQKVSIPDENFKPGVVHDFWVTAFNEAGESAPSTKIQWTRPGYSPEPDSSPDTVYIMPGTPTTLIIINQ